VNKRDGASTQTFSGHPEELIARITHAFQGLTYPGDAEISDSSGDEAEAVIQVFQGQDDWRKLSGGFLDEAPKGWGSALSFFSPSALRFYLPAYLVADLRGELERVDPADRLCAFLTPQSEGQRLAQAWGGGTMGERERATFDALDRKQCEAVVAYLWWKLDQEEGQLTVEQAMEHYWLPRLAELR
jgi:hypothetical protein